MARLNKTESSQVMKLMGDPAWLCLMKLVNLTVSDLNSRKVSGMNEFETLRSLFTREGRVSALEEFFNDLESGQSLTGERS